MVALLGSPKQNGLAEYYDEPGAVGLVARDSMGIHADFKVDL